MAQLCFKELSALLLSLEFPNHLIGESWPKVHIRVKPCFRLQQKCLIKYSIESAEVVVRILLSTVV